jgi:hypothetical protein
MLCFVVLYCCFAVGVVCYNQLSQLTEPLTATPSIHCAGDSGSVFQRPISFTLFSASKGRPLLLLLVFHLLLLLPTSPFACLCLRLCAVHSLICSRPKDDACTHTSAGSCFCGFIFLLYPLLSAICHLPSVHWSEPMGQFCCSVPQRLPKQISSLVHDASFSHFNFQCFVLADFGFEVCSFFCAGAHKELCAALCCCAVAIMV